MKNKESNAEIVKREKDKFRINKLYLIQTKSNKKTTDKLATNILARCVKKYRTYALFDVVDNKGGTLKEKMINEKALKRMMVKDKIEVLEQKQQDNIITRREVIVLRKLRDIKKKLEKDILKLYSID